MDKEELKLSTKQFGLRVLKLVRALPKDVAGRAWANQLVRSGTSVGANYCAACRARSKAEFRAKLGTVLEEADESAFWLELIMEDGMLSKSRVNPLRIEADELYAIAPSTPPASAANFKC
jgi:four helix bundle protein